MLAGIKKVVKILNSNFDLLKSLKEDTFLETFKNVSSYNKLKSVKKEIRKIKGTKKKNPEGYKIKQSLFEQEKNAETLSIQEREVERKHIYKLANLEYLKQKRAKGKKVSKLEIKCLKNEDFKNKYSFLKKSGILAGLAWYANKDNISLANDELGIMAAIEQADKASVLAILGLGVIGPASRNAKNLATTVSLHVPKYGVAINIIGIVSVTLTTAFGIKSIIKNAWQTKYEKLSEEKIKQNL